MFCYTILFCYISSQIFTFGEAYSDHVHDMLWCRHCGISVGNTSYIFDKQSPGALKFEHKMVFGRNVSVQTLVNPFLFMFDVVTTTKASCADLGRNTRGDSWFPGYSWRVCTCPSCASQLGWTFERTLNNDIADTNENETFHALILSSLYEKSSEPQVTTPLPTTYVMDDTPPDTEASVQPRASEVTPTALDKNTSLPLFKPRASEDTPIFAANNTSTANITNIPNITNTTNIINTTNVSNTANVTTLSSDVSSSTDSTVKDKKDIMIPLNISDVVSV